MTDEFDPDTPDPTREVQEDAAARERQVNAEKDLELCGGRLLLHEDEDGNVGGLAVTGISGGADYIGDFNNGGYPRTLHLTRLDDEGKSAGMKYVAQPETGEAVREATADKVRAEMTLYKLPQPLFDQLTTNELAVIRNVYAIALRAHAEQARAEERAARDFAYSERNQLVALLARLFPSGVARTDIPGWDAEWHGCVYIDLPTGQASWHFHDSEAHLFDGLPPYTKEWDGHTTEEKYRRLIKLIEPDIRQRSEAPDDR